MKNMIKCLLALLVSLNVGAMAEEITKLPSIKANSGVLSILSKRKSSRSFNPTKEISEKTLGEMLWAAFGISHGDGQRTIPTAKDTRDLTVYVVKKSGVWKYIPETHSLLLITKDNLYHLFNSQSFVDDATLNLVYTSSDDKNYSFMHAGSSYQNVAIYCAEKGVGNVVRGYFDADSFKKALKLDKKTNVIISQAVGY
jgi:nitroreductase